jgi:hypothetical protein
VVHRKFGAFDFAGRFGTARRRGRERVQGRSGEHLRWRHGEVEGHDG